jgi:gliding motility-associated-like protein
VQGFGSGSGYNYTWISAATNATVGSGSVTGNIASVNGLAPGVYSIVLSGLGAAGCGSAVATTTINVGPAGIISVLKPFCGNEAYLSATGGSNFQWYNGTSAISPTAGGQAMSYTVTNPVNQSIYWLSYLSQFGCQDSVKFTLVSSTPGVLGTPQVSWICPGGTNGTAIITMTPAAGAPPGTNSWSVYALGTTPAYNASIYPTAANSYTATNLAAGSYSIRAFDGSCKYGTSFSVNAFIYTWNITPTLSALCPGQSVASSITFPTPPSQTQYSYSWTPNVWLAGNANTYSSTIITPVVPVGQNITTIYTVIVTPSLVNCPTTKTISITGINPPIPTITAIPNLCNNSSPYNILVSPTGGTFITGVTGTANPISLSGGVITPSLCLIGSNNSVTYSISVGSCGASSTASYQVNQFNPASLTSSVPPLCVTNAPFNLMNIVLSAANGTWMPASGVTNTGPGAYSFNPANLLTQPYAITYSTTSSPNPTVCPASTVIIVNVTNTITPAITAVPEQCTNFSVKNMTVSPSGGSWYGNPAVSPGGVLTPSAMPVPSSVVFYSVQIGPCVNTNSTTLQASTYNPSSFSAPVPNQCFNGAAYNLMSITQNTAGTWTHIGPGPQATTIPNGVFLPSVFSASASLSAVTNTLQYFVASFPNANLCPSINTLTVSIYHPPTPQISNVGPYCNNASAVQLTVSPAAGYWTTSSYLNGNGVFTPSLSNAGNNAVQYVIGTSNCFAQQTKFVGVEAFVSAKIISPLPDQCNNGAVINLSPYTMNNSGNWIGAGIVGNNFNPSMTGAGTFTLIHKTASVPSGLCPDEDQLAVNVFSLATPVLGTLSPLCNNSKPIQIQVSPVGGTFSGVNVGAVSLAGKFSPASAVIGTNLINYSITSGPCKAYVQMTVEVEEFVSAAFTKSVAPICLIPGKTLPVSLNSYVANAGSTWEVNGNFQGENGMFDPNGANIKYGKDNKVVHYTSSLPTGACKDQQELMIEVRKMPEVKALSNSSVACVPAEIVFNTPSVSDGDGTWNFDDGSDSKPGLTVSHVYTTPGTYIVTFSYKDGIGCEALPVKVSAVRINAAPQADFSFPDEIFISSPQVQLTNLTTVLGDNTYNWKFSNALAPSTEVNPTVTFPAIGKYQVSLTATSPAAAGGCTSQVTKMIEVKNDFYIYIPTAFSPNFDNLNDVFRPEVSEFGLDAKNYEMEIFDRWGHSLFRTTDYKKGWDGKNKVGEPMKEEVYIYRIKYKDSDGNAYSKMGHVSLLK